MSQLALFKRSGKSICDLPSPSKISLMLPFKKVPIFRLMTIALSRHCMVYHQSPLWAEMSFPRATDDAMSSASGRQSVSSPLDLPRRMPLRSYDGCRSRRQSTCMSLDSNMPRTVDRQKSLKIEVEHCHTYVSLGFQFYCSVFVACSLNV